MCTLVYWKQNYLRYAKHLLVNLFENEFIRVTVRKTCQRDCFAFVQLKLYLLAFCLKLILL